MEEDKGAKHLKTELPVNNVKNRLLSAIKAMVDSMNEEHLYSVMVYAGALGIQKTAGY